MPDTEVLPVPAELLPMTGVHVLRHDRCVVEVSLRLLGRPILRGRFAAVHGEWTFGGDRDELRVVLDPASLRTGVPLLHRALTGRPTELGFDAGEIDLFADRTVHIAGHVQLPSGTRELRLSGDLRHVGDGFFVVWATGALPPSRHKPRRLGLLARVVARRRLHVEIAIEFVR